MTERALEPGHAGNSIDGVRGAHQPRPKLGLGEGRRGQALDLEEVSLGLPGFLGGFL